MKFCQRISIVGEEGAYEGRGRREIRRMSLQTYRTPQQVVGMSWTEALMAAMSTRGDCCDFCSERRLKTSWRTGEGVSVDRGPWKIR